MQDIFSAHAVLFEVVGHMQRCCWKGRLSKT